MITLLLAGLVGTSVSVSAVDFHLKNKSALDIQYEVTNAGRALGVKRLAAGSGQGVNINIKEGTRLDIFYCPTATYCKTSRPKLLSASFPYNKRIFVKWDGKTLRPQEGGLFGIKNNIKSENIMIAGGVKDPWNQFPDAKLLLNRGLKREAYLSVLGLKCTATSSEIKKAYYKLSLTWHPDKGGDAEVFKVVGEAYAYLK